MQNNTCVELRMDAPHISEDDFATLMSTFDALGGSEESNQLTGQHERIAWFEVSSNAEEQYKRLETAAALFGLKEEQFSIKTLGDDWATAWQDHWTAMPIGKSLCVRPSFCEALPDRAIDVVLDPGQAFGTGTHPTTYLCLEAIEDYCLNHPPKSLLDMGAGSGLLAIAAAKMGAQNIMCVDYDPLSVEACEVNAGINNISLTSILGDTPPAQTFELVVANILYNPLIDMVKPLVASVDKHLILSGILSEQVPALIQAYAAHGLIHHNTRNKEEWAVVEFIR